MKVYIVELGEYSDRYIAGVYSSRENAELALRNNYGIESVDDYIDEADVDVDIDRMAAGFKGFTVYMRRNGDVVRIDPGYSEDSTTWTTQEWRSGHMRDGQYVPYGNVELPAPEHRRFFGCWAYDKDHAVKIANERRIQLLAAEQPASGEGT